MLDVFEALTNALISQSEDRMLSMIENILWLIFFFKGFSGDLFRRLNELTQQRLSAHDFRELHDAGDVWQTVREVRQEQNSTRLVERVIATQFFRDQNRVDFRSALEQSDHRDKDSSMRWNVEVARLQKLDCLRD